MTQTLGIVVNYLGGVIKYLLTTVTGISGFNLVVSVISVVRVNIVQWFQRETYLNRPGLDQRMKQIKELSNKVKNYHSLRSFGRANARPF